MSTYAIGDIQGCFDELQALLDRLAFDPAADTLWFTGDLVNRGPRSLETLRFVRGLGGRAVTVLGNHDLHLLAVWRDRHRHFKSNDTLQAIFAAEDGDELLEWLRHQPLLHHDGELDYTMVHAGLPPQWDLATAQACAREVEALLQGDDFLPFLQQMYGNKPTRWDEALQGWERARFIVNSFTRLRYCRADGHLEFKNKGRPGEQGDELIPWFQMPGRRSQEQRIVFGHWSTLGLHCEDNVCAIDTGCLWGGSLTALRLEDDHTIQYDCPLIAQPGID